MQESHYIDIQGVRLSENPETIVEKDENGIEGKVNINKNGNKFVIIEIVDTSNFRKFHKRNLIYSTNDKGKWPALPPREMIIALEEARNKKQPVRLIGRTVTHNVQPYEIDGKTVSTYTTIVLSDENEITVFNASKHPIIQDNTLLIPVEEEEKISIKDLALA